MLRPIYPYNVARKMYNVTNGAGFKDSIDTTKAFLRQPLYDVLAVDSAAGVQNLSFFTTKGNKFKTNMSLQGQLPNGQDFLAEQLQLYFIPGVLNTPLAISGALTRAQYLNDVAAFYNGGYAEINVLSQNWLTISPLMMAPPANRLTGALAIGLADSDTTAATETIAIAESTIASAGGDVYELNGLWLPANTNFEVTVNLNLASGLPSGVDGSLIAILNGVMYRNTQ